jgi:heat shock protein HslJ
MKRILSLFSLVIALTFISADDVPKFVQNWELKSMNGKSVDGKCSLKIERNGQYSGKGFCNNYAGNFTFSGKREVMANPNMISTKKMCTENMNQETEYFATLMKATSYKVKDGQLIFMADKTPLLIFDKIVEAPTGKKKKK